MKLFVNGEKIPAHVCEQHLQQYRREHPDIPDDEAKKTVADDIVARTLVRQEANKKVTIDDSDVDKEFSAIAGQYGGEDQFLSRFRMTKKDLPRVKKDITRRMRLDRFLGELTRDVAPPPESDIRSYYDAHKDRFVSGEEIKASHIVKEPLPSDPLKTFGELKDARQKIKDGLPFARMADIHSSCNDKGGDLGWFARGKMVEEFETVVFSMNVGEVSPVFKTPFGLHIATVTDRREPRQLDYEEAREQVTRQLHAELKNRHIEQWAASRRKKASVQVKD